MAFLSTRSGQFAYFAIQIGLRDWSGKEVLDFGGNVGNILRDPQSTISEGRYWCLDVVREAIEEGARQFPEAHWLFYDRYNFAFNPRGRPGLEIPEFPRRFDIIVAYSVFTSTPKDEMLDLVGQLRGLLAEGGVLAFTFIDPHHRSWPGQYDGTNLRWRLERHRSEGAAIDIPALLARAEGAGGCTLINDGDLYLEGEPNRPYGPGERTSCHVYYSACFMKALFPDAEVRPPANGEMQHCCVLRG